MMAEMWAYCGQPDRQIWDFAAGSRPAFATAILSSSADDARREEQRRFGFADLVDVIGYCHEVGITKPDPAIFTLTEELPRVEPRETCTTTTDMSRPLARADGTPFGTVTRHDRFRRSATSSELLRASLAGLWTVDDAPGRRPA
jgi:hypothetical protein